LIVSTICEMPASKIKTIFKDIFYHNRESLSGFSKESKFILVGILFSAIGNGMVLPYLFIYLHQERGISALQTGLLAAAGGVISLAATPIMGTLIDHWGAKRTLFVGLGISFFGFLYLAQIHNFTQGLIAILIENTGAVAMWPAQSALAVQHLKEEVREKFFATQFAFLNLGIGTGGIISSIIVNLHRVSTFQWLYRFDAFTFIIYFFVVFRIPAKIFKVQTKENSKGGWREVLQDHKFIKFWIIAILAVFFGYSQLEIGFTSFATLMSKVSPAQIAIAFAINTAIITLLQVPFLNWIKKLKGNTATSLATLFWALAWVALALSVPMKNFAVLGVILCQIIFAFGEMVWSPIAPGIVNKLAPAHLRGRYNSMMGATWQVGAIMGPLFVGVFLNYHLEWLWVSLLASGLLLLTLFLQKIKIDRG
jgi:MFS family permease